MWSNVCVRYEDLNDEFDFWRGKNKFGSLYLVCYWFVDVIPIALYEICRFCHCVARRWCASTSAAAAAAAAACAFCSGPPLHGAETGAAPLAHPLQLIAAHSKRVEKTADSMNTSAD